MNNKSIEDGLMVPEAGIEPARTKSARDFKSLASTNSTTPAHRVRYTKSVVTLKQNGNLY